VRSARLTSFVRIIFVLCDVLGEVLVWDLSREDDLLLVSSGVGKNSHLDPVTKLHWVVDTDAPSRKYNVSYKHLCNYIEFVFSLGVFF
jgi:hypothetical protein